LARSWAGWQQSWDDLEQALVPNREWLIAGLVDVVEAVVQEDGVVVDLACGPGTVALRLLERRPTGSVIAVDVDPVLLTIASGTFAGDRRVRLVDADLRDRAWSTRLPEPAVDAVVTATALHWLAEPVVRRVYGELAGLIRPGGVFAHAERMPVDDIPTLAAAMAKRPDADTATLWERWWNEAAADPRLANAWRQRAALFDSTYPADEFSPPAGWHTSALSDAGFREAGVIYRAGGGAIVAALR
jgi:SAM-dependent methyltransferase